MEFSNNQQTKYYALQILESVIKTRWKVLPRNQCEGIKKYIVGLIIKTSSDQQVMEKEKTYLNKLNMILVQVSKPQSFPFEHICLCNNVAKLFATLYCSSGIFHIDSMVALMCVAVCLYVLQSLSRFIQYILNILIYLVYPVHHQCIVPILVLDFVHPDIELEMKIQSILPNSFSKLFSHFNSVTSVKVRFKRVYST